jgi:hypothetical protein
MRIRLYPDTAMRGIGLVLAAASLLGCDPYQHRNGEFSAGPVDPSGFPAAYLGANGDPKFGGGVFAPTPAWAGGQPIGYYAFPLSTPQQTALAMGADPLALSVDGKDAGVFTTPLAYAFDPTSSSPIPAESRCTPPAGYVYNVQRDGISYAEQGNLFAALPKNDGYVPIVSEVAVTTLNESCQSIKSVETLMASASVQLNRVTSNSSIDAVATGVPDGRYIAWALIDPGAEVDYLSGKPTAATNYLGPQKFGWYDHYLVAYLDGGYIPTVTTTIPGMNGMPDSTVVDFATQVLYVPSQIPGTDTNGNPATVPTGGVPGSGYDVLHAARGSDGYSPICQVMTFNPADPMNPPTDEAAIDMTTVMPAPTPFVYCLQLQ